MSSSPPNSAVIADATKKHGATPLVKAAEMGDQETVISLVKAGYKDLEEKGTYERTAII